MSRVAPIDGRPANPIARGDGLAGLQSGPLEFVPFEAAHMDGLQLQPVQMELTEMVRGPGIGTALAAGGMAWSGLINGVVVGCAGFHPIWPGRATAWALIGPVPRRCWPRITRRVARGLAEVHAAGWFRIEATSVRGFAAGARWLRMLGFERRCLLPAYDPAGNDHWLFDHISFAGDLGRPAIRMDEEH